MSKVEFFKPIDFKDDPLTRLNSIEAANAANAKLEREAKRVYGKVNWGAEQSPSDSLTALLIDIQPIKSCEHPLEKINTKAYYEYTDERYFYKCECGARVTPTAFKKVES